MTPGPQHSVSVAAIVVNDDGAVLMVQRRDNGKWEPPGGVLELDEPILDGLRREVREETGFDVRPERLTGVYKNMTHGIIALVFRAHITGGRQTDATAETTRLQWLSVDQLQHHCDEAFAIRALDALADTAPAIRAHDGVHVHSDRDRDRACQASAGTRQTATAPHCRISLF
jgi:8-oxo-dGTP pyrophosphatase MutT (NUDIX family)